jgi:hypothetical protein
VTTEIAVANRWGIALAADSAVTIEQVHKGKPTEKVYNSANKLFTLSKFHPVGSMIYNGMTLGGTPWETIVKTIRRELKHQEFRTLEEYCSFFFSSLSSHRMLFPESMTRSVVARNMYRALYEIIGEYVEEAEPDFSKMTADIADAITKSEQADQIEGMDESFQESIFEQYGVEFDSILALLVPQHEEHPEFKKIAQKLIGTWFTRKKKIPGYSGIVICGFGSDDVFPKLSEYYADSIICGRVRYWKHQDRAIDPNSASFVIPFADSEVLNTLLNGINPAFYQKFGQEIYKLVMGLPELLVGQIVELSDQQKAKYADLLRQSVVRPFQELEDELREFRMSEYVHPIEGTLQVLPISELAIVA